MMVFKEIRQKSRLSLQVGWPTSQLLIGETIDVGAEDGK